MEEDAWELPVSPPASTGSPHAALRRALVCALALAVLLPAVLARAGERVGVTVEAVIDGDTVDVREGGRRHRVRLLGVDTPEIGHDGQPGEPFGRAAARFTRDALRSARRVELEVAGDRVDSYGRLLGFLWLLRPAPRQPVNLSAELLQQGLARAVRRFEYPEKARFLALEAEARRHRRGLWRRRGPG